MVALKLHHLGPIRGTIDQCQSRAPIGCAFRFPSAHHNQHEWCVSYQALEHNGNQDSGLAPDAMTVVLFCPTRNMKGGLVATFLATPLCLRVCGRCTPLRYTDGRPPGAGKFAISMENAQEGVWLLVISLSYPRQILSNICVQWPSRARDACAKTPVPRRDFPPFLRAPLMTFSSKEWFHFVPNDWR